ncbi:MAG: hypothetical protein ACLPYO_17325 [Mycobacterium sp.]
MATWAVTALKALVRSILAGGIHPGSSSCRCQRSREMMRVLRSAATLDSTLDVVVAIETLLEDQ